MFSDVFDAFLGKSNSRGEPGIPSTSRTVEGGLPGVEPGNQGANEPQKGAKVEKGGEGGSLKPPSTTQSHVRPYVNRNEIFDTN